MQNPMTRGQLIEAARASGAPAQPHHVDQLLRAGAFDPRPTRMGGIYVYGERHLEQLLALVARIGQKRAASDRVAVAG